MLLIDPVFDSIVNEGLLLLLAPIRKTSGGVAQLR